MKVFLPLDFEVSTNSVLNTWGGAATSPSISKTSTEFYTIISATWDDVDVEDMLKADNENYISITNVLMPKTYQPFIASKTYDIFAQLFDGET